MTNTYDAEATGVPKGGGYSATGRMRGYSTENISPYESRFSRALGGLQECLRQASSYKVLRQKESNEIVDTKKTRDHLVERGYLTAIRKLRRELSISTNGMAGLLFDKNSGSAIVYVWDKIVGEYDFSHLRKAS